MRADAFLAARRIAVRETADARKERYSKDDLSELFRDCERLIAILRKQRHEFDLARGGSFDELADAVIGPTGGLRAPTIVVGATALVGFDEAAWAAFFDSAGRDPS